MKLPLTLIAAAAILLTLPAHSDPRETQSLDGTWQIAFDKENTGREARWHKKDTFSKLKNLRPIEVPSCWELIEQDYEGVAFYGTRFKVDEAWKDKSVRLHFDAVNYIAEVWLNDHAIGRHEGGYAPFEFRIDDLLKFGAENFLSLRVLGPIVAQNKVIDGLGMNDAPHWRGAIAGGIWQSVRLVATGPVVVDDTFIIPSLKDNTAKIQLTLDNTEPKGRQVQVEISIHPSGADQAVATKSAALQLRPGKNDATWSLQIPNPRHWSPDNPHLYTARITVTGQGQQLDSDSVRFGMRELTIRNKRFELNGKPIYIKAAFFEGLYPNGLAFPDSEEMARREIQLAKDADFNMIRPWRKPPPPMWLDLCDELGVMVVGGLPIECMKRWPTATPQMPWRIENEVRSAILRDRNRACIVQWEIFNEIWRPELRRLKHPASMLARQLDPSRLILDESGGFAGGANIYLPGRFEPEKFNDIHRYPGAPLNTRSYDDFLALGRPDQEVRALGLDPKLHKNKHAIPGLMTVVSEIGYGSLPDLVDNNARFAKDGNPLAPPYRYHKMLADSFRKALKESGLNSVYPDLKQFCLDQQQLHSDGNKRMIEAIRSNPGTRGYAVHALTGGDWVLGAGLLDLFRNPKKSYYGTKEANQPRYLALQVRPRNIYAEKGTRILLTGINDNEKVSGTLIVSVTNAAGNRILQQEKTIDLAHGISSLLNQPLDTKALAGAYAAEVQLTSADGKLVARNSVAFDVFTRKQLTAQKSKIAILDPDNTLRPFLKARGVPFVEFADDTPHNTPVFVGRVPPNNPQVKPQFKALEEFVKQGGTAVYLQSVNRNAASPYWSGNPLNKELLPVSSTMKRSMGLWVGVSHIVTKHPLFSGLPSKCMMGQAYENVYPTQSLVGTGGKIIAGSVSHGFYGGQDTKQNYLGPEPAWAGMDLGTVPHEQGRYILCSLRLLENLGKDPLADKLLLNLINWTSAAR